MNAFVEAARHYISLGFAVLPMKGREGFLSGGHSRAARTDAEAEALFGSTPGLNLALVWQPGLLVIDVDPRNGGEDSLLDWEMQNGTLPETVMSHTGRGGTHLYFRCDPARELKSELAPGIDILSHKMQAIEWPSVTERQYRWVDGHAPGEFDFAEAPEAVYKPARKSNGDHRTNGAAAGSDRASKYCYAAISGEKGRLAHTGKGERNKRLFVAAAALGNLAHYGAFTETEARAALMAACEQNGLIADDGMEACLLSFKSGWMKGLDEPKEMPPGDPKYRTSREEQAQTTQQAPPSDDPADDSLAFTEDSLAVAFADAHAERLRYVAAWGRWYEWDGSCWCHDLTLQAYDLVRAACRSAAIQAKGKSRKAKLKAAQTVAAVEKLARSDRRLAATVDQWDANPWILNTPEGAVDLQTGKLRRSMQDDYCTRCTQVTPFGQPDLWLTFLRKITNSDHELLNFLHRLSGYALTGLTREHAMFFGYGTGANGKSVFLNTLMGVLGDYAVSAPIEIFMASKSEQHPTGLAGLRGARLVTAIETEEGRRWAESKIKALTGGDRIAARFMRQDFFEFTPHFKLLIAGNHKPGLRGVDEAIRRRFVLLPFQVTIPEQERDPDLYEKLKSEWPQILAWMIEGCISWQEKGLNPPDSVLKATEHYLDTEDALSQWMTERCDTGPFFYSTSSALFADWKIWADAAGEFVGSQKRFAQTLESRGFTAKREGGTGKMGFAGITLKPIEQTSRTDI